MEIRDDVGDGTAATKIVRIKAASFIQGDDKPGVVVNVNTQTNVSQMHLAISSVCQRERLRRQLRP
jgi:hypothetical protein